MTFDAVAFLAGLVDEAPVLAVLEAATPAKADRPQGDALDGKVLHPDAQPLQAELAAVPLELGTLDAADLAALEAGMGLREVWTPETPGPDDDWQRRRLLYLDGCRLSSRVVYCL